MAQGLTNKIVNSVPGMRVVAIYNRRADRAHRGLRIRRARETRSSPPRRISSKMRFESGKPAVTEDAFLLARSEQIDVLVDTTGSVEFGARVVLEAFEHGKDVVLMNAEIDATIGPILQVYADKHGVILSACDGDEPGVQMNLYRWVKGLGLTPRVMGNVKGLQDPYRNPDHPEGLRREVGPEPGDGHELRRRIEDQLRAGHRRQRHRLRREVARHVARPRVPRRRHEDRQRSTTSTSCAGSAASSTTSSARR